MLSEHHLCYIPFQFLGPRRICLFTIGMDCNNFLSPIFTTAGLIAENQFHTENVDVKLLYRWSRYKVIKVYLKQINSYWEQVTEKLPHWMIIKQIYFES